jgi:tryptophan-rich sensory protein
MIGCKEFDNDFIMDIYIYILIELSKLQLGVAVGVSLMVTTMAITFMSWDMRPVQQVFFANSKRIWTYFFCGGIDGWII